MSERSEQIDAILSAAVELATRHDRAKYIQQACAGDDELQREVEELVDAYLSAGDFLASPVPGIPPTVDFGVEESAGTSIGRYKLLQQIGEGGFAVVFMAEQEQPVRRRVAVKVIKPGMDSRHVIARFEAERQALAMMDHSNIAKVLDAGTTESGRPYFVMELVKGKPITDYCDEHCLSIDERLALFSQVCDAVQHAHQKGVIHRDIKPSNVLVRKEDEKPVVKVIDFGIAKATETRLTDRTLFTDFRQLIGTPAYMSPEQADGSLDIDTRSDVYSLGVLLYELLSGSPPFDPRELQSRAIAEMQRIIREVEPPAPSARLSTLDADTRVLKAKARGVEPGRLTQRLRGELDWIALRALEKDRNRRYGSAAALADDINRYAANEPVEACPPSTAYRLRKLVHRNQFAFAMASAIAAALLIGTAVSTWQAVRATRANRAASEARDKAIVEMQRADEQAAVAAAVNVYLQDLLAAATPNLERQVTVVEAIEQASRKLEAGALRDQPLVQEAVRVTIEETVHALAESYSRAIDRLPDERGWWSSRSRLLTEATRQPILFNAVAKLRPKDNLLWVCRARDLAVRDHLREAVDQFTLVIEDTPQGVDWYTYAVLRLLAGDEEGYSMLVTRMSSWNDREGLKARTAAASIDSPIAPQQIVDWAEHDVEQGRTKEAYFTLGLAHYRAGQYAQAVEDFRASSQATGADASAHRSLVQVGLALVRHAQGQESEALQLSRDAGMGAGVIGLNLRNFGTPVGADGWIELKLLLREFAILRGAPDIPSDVLNEQTRNDPWAAMANQLLQDLIINSGNPDASGKMAVALLKLERYEDYDRLCHTFLSEAKSLREMRVAAKVALLRPVQDRDFELACRLADESVASAQNTEFEPWARLTKALAEYRRERFESAIDWSQRAISAGATPAGSALGQFIQASSLARLGRFDAARDALAKGGETEAPSHPSQGDWPNWAAADLLRREAEGLLATPSSANSHDNAPAGK